MNLEFLSRIHIVEELDELDSNYSFPYKLMITLWQIYRSSKDLDIMIVSILGRKGWCEVVLIITGVDLCLLRVFVVKEDGSVLIGVFPLGSHVSDCVQNYICPQRIIAH